MDTVNENTVMVFWLNITIELSNIENILECSMVIFFFKEGGRAGHTFDSGKRKK
ncbi:UNVERIFIED_CONTAM: hypothetical protein FKN15_062679 [Acipenser sinensis]